MLKRVDIEGSFDPHISSTGAINPVLGDITRVENPTEEQPVASCALTRSKKLQSVADRVGLTLLIPSIFLLPTKDISTVATDVPIEILAAQERQVPIYSFMGLQIPDGLPVPDVMFTYNGQRVGLAFLFAAGTCFALAHRDYLKSRTQTAVSNIRRLFTYC